MGLLSWLSLNREASAETKSNIHPPLPGLSQLLSPHPGTGPRAGSRLEVRILGCEPRLGAQGSPSPPCAPPAPRGHSHKLRWLLPVVPVHLALLLTVPCISGMAEGDEAHEEEADGGWW